MNTLEHPLFESTHLWGRFLPNRTVVAPMSRVSATADRLATTEMEHYYTAFAAGDFSVIITEGCYTASPNSQAYAHQPGLMTSAQTQAWANVAAAIKCYPTLLIAQLMHAGALSQFSDPSYAPSSITPVGRKMPQYGGEGSFPTPKELTGEEVEHVKQGFIRSALNAHQAGFDGVELHAANGYLLDQFVTAELNTRIDAYGGDTHARFRLIAEIITGIRNQVPADFLIGLRLSEGKVNDLAYRWPQGQDTATEVLQQVHAASPDYVHIAVQSGEWEKDSFYPSGDSLTSLARRITALPVIANGGMHHLDRAERVLREHHADLLAIGKAALADPNWPVKRQNQQSVIDFHWDMLWPRATISHTRAVMEAQH